MKRNSLFRSLVLTGWSIALVGVPTLSATAEPVSISKAVTNPLPISATSVVRIVDPKAGNDTKADGSERLPFKTITQALQTAQPNTVLLLRPGTYSQQSGEQFPIHLRPGVTLYGDPETRGQAVVIRGSGLFLSPIASRQSVAVVVTTPSTIMGVTITNPDLKGTGIWIESTNARVESNTLSGSGQAGLKVVGKRAAPGIVNNYFVRNKSTGLVLSDFSQAEVEGNIVEASGVGILVGQQAAPVIRQNRVTENIDGIIVQTDAKPTLQNNSIERNQRSGVVMANTQPGSLALGGMGGDTPDSSSSKNKELAPQITFGQRLTKPTTASPVVPQQQIAVTSQASTPSPLFTATVPSVRPKAAQPTSSNSPPIIEFAQPLPGRSTANSPLLQSVVVRPIPVSRPTPVVVRPVQPKSQPVTLNVLRAPSPASKVVTIPVPAPETNAARPVSPTATTMVATASSSFTKGNFATLQLLPVPDPNVPLGNVGNSPEVAIYQGSFQQSDTISPPTPVMQISRGSLRYRVVVPINNDNVKSQVRSMVPTAFLTSTNGQQVMQLGAFNDRDKADELLKSLANQGIKAILESFE